MWGSEEPAQEEDPKRGARISMTALTCGQDMCRAAALRLDVDRGRYAA